MSAKVMRQLGEVGSIIRDIAEYGAMRKAEIGEENVFDFSIGNPSIQPPQIVTDELCRLLTEEDPLTLHSYTSAAGDVAVRSAIADYLNGKHATAFRAENLYLTAGASESLAISLSAVLEDGDEVIVFAPFFPEYTVFIRNAGGVPVSVMCRESDFQIDFDRLAQALNEKTRAVIINSPNNPSGVVLSEDTLRKLAAVLTEAGEKYGHTIYLIADEPYRELVYGDAAVPFVTPIYPNTIVCYSYSKSLSLPGDRIGYVLVSPDMEDWQGVYNAVAGAGRALGYICAPALFQKLLPACLGMTSDLSVYARNRELLYNALISYGYSTAQPDGAFYLFVKALEEDAAAFCQRAKKYELLLVPSDDFGMPGYVRIAYCVSTEQIERSLPAFEQLAKEYLHG